MTIQVSNKDMAVSDHKMISVLHPRMFLSMHELILHILAMFSLFHCIYRSSYLRRQTTLYARL